MNVHNAATGAGAEGRDAEGRDAEGRDAETLASEKKCDFLHRRRPVFPVLPTDPAHMGDFNSETFLALLKDLGVDVRACRTPAYRATDKTGVDQIHSAVGPMLGRRAR